ncbi:hypothetical protein F9K97_20175 [Brucella anthropi]|uniref:Uncharacterized protein n=1 Tax=Brucella anthropi TaxID=529 RepID=A0A6I0D5U3_BRUAN|nr:hypothetical protein F9L04_21650 [Brucella anthropi]KAB2781873.1 hypothetical protein F9K97_20175 [Brucella anthropi]
MGLYESEPVLTKSSELLYLLVLPHYATSNVSIWLQNALSRATRHNMAKFEPESLNAGSTLSEIPESSGFRLSGLSAGLLPG